MNPLVKSDVPVAVDRFNKFNLDSNHLTTGNFMQFNLAYCRQLMPGSHGKLNHKTFMRAEPLDKPCLGSAQIHNAAYFVPFRTVWEPFSDFVTDTPHNQPSGTGIIPNVPSISSTNLNNLFTTTSNGLTRIVDSGAFDFSANSKLYVLTPFGRQVLKVLESLGYKLLFGKKIDYSALPLLSLAKVYLDFYFPKAYAHYGVFAIIDGIFQRHVTYTLSVDELLSIFEVICYVGYNDDFFSSIWDNPSSPNNGVGSINFIIPDVTQSTFGTASAENVVQDVNGTPIHVSSGQGSSWSQYIDSTVKALTKYVKRHQLSSYTIDRYLMEFGISLDADKLRRCVYLGDDSFPFQIGDVMSMAATSEASLGAYSGKGIGFSQGHSFDFDVQEFGYLFVINTIIPDVSYVQGIDKNVLCRSKLDFITGEFDGLGPDVVRQYEVLVDNTNVASSYNNASDGIFGFAPRYYFWKIPYNRMTGSFVNHSINTDLNSWSTARLFDPSLYNSDPSSFKHNLDFVIGKDSLQYDRIFLGYSDDDAVDPFFIVHRDEMTLYANMKPLYEDCLFDDDEDTEKRVSVRVGGVNVN